ncbi:MAG: VOC family protein [Defluviitaleaceae bacterium]|nr:VOC family protein [Defluviitaleaceae bacterium]
MPITKLQLYLKNCDQAIELYQKAFDAIVGGVWGDESGLIAHAEINVFGQCVAFMEQKSDCIIGNTMQFCFYFSKSDEEIIKKAYDVLKDGAKIELPLGPCEWSSLIFCLVDKFGVNWLLCVD